jgi:hypothetical protein
MLPAEIIRGYLSVWIVAFGQYGFYFLYFGFSHPDVTNIGCFYLGTKIIEEKTYPI